MPRVPGPRTAWTCPSRRSAFQLPFPSSFSHFSHPPLLPFRAFHAMSSVYQGAWFRATDLPCTSRWDVVSLPSACPVTVSPICHTQSHSPELLFLSFMTLVTLVFSWKDVKKGGRAAGVMRGSLPDSCHRSHLSSRHRLHTYPGGITCHSEAGA